MKKHIAVLPGDGIGPEITAQALRALQKIAEKFNHQFVVTEGFIGAVAVDHKLKPLPDETLELCLKSDAVLLGTIGNPLKYDDQYILTSLLDIRKKLGLYANIRPILTFPSLYNKSPLKTELIKDVNFVVIRELTGGIYFGQPRERRDGGNTAVDTCIYTRKEIERISHVAFTIAQKRGKHITVVDKANVLETSRLWRETVQEMAKNYPDIKIDFLLVDNASMQIIKRPRDFDVILTENMFGDILTDEASVITGSLGMLPSASIGEKTSLFEPIHGSFPKAAGKNIANPVGTILSAAMMLEYSFSLKEERDAIFNAVENALSQGYGTKDIVGDNPLGTIEFTDRIIEAI